MNDDEKLITALFSELSESYNEGDVERFTSAFYTENVSLIGTAVDEIRLDIEQIRSQFQRDIDQTLSRDLSFKKFDFFLQGEFAYVVSKLEFKGKTTKDESFVLNMRISAMLEKTHEKWLFRHLHCSVPDKNVKEGNSI